MLNRQLPDPLVASDVDLDGFPGFMLNVDRFLSSELVALCTPEEGWSAFNLWCRAWKQQPPASLPNDERLLAAFSGAGKRWKAVRPMALRGFVLCSDGRLYHRVLAAEANEAWRRRLKFRERSEKANAKRWKGGEPGAADPPKPPSGPTGSGPSGTPSAILQGVQQGVQQGVLEDAHKESLRSPVDVTETGQDGDIEKTKDDDDGSALPLAPGGDPPAGAVVVDADARAVRAGQIVAFCRRRSIRLTGSDPTVLAWAEDPAITDEALGKAIAAAVANRVAARSMQPVNSRYLDAILRADDGSAAAPPIDYDRMQAEIERMQRERGVAHASD